jgi:hypothetical protein
LIIFPKSMLPLLYCEPAFRLRVDAFAMHPLRNWAGTMTTFVSELITVNRTPSDTMYRFVIIAISLALVLDCVHRSPHGLNP